MVDIVGMVYLSGIIVLLYLIYNKYQAYIALRSIGKSGCASCRSVSVIDGQLTEEESKKILQGDRIALKKIGGKTSVRKRTASDMSEVVGELVFLNDDYLGGEVMSDDQIIYPVVGRRLKGKIVLQPVRNGEQWVLIVGK